MIHWIKSRSPKSSRYYWRDDWELAYCWARGHSDSEFSSSKSPCKPAPLYGMNDNYATILMNCFEKSKTQKKNDFSSRTSPICVSLEKFLSEIHRSSALLRPCSDWCFECLWLQVLGSVSPNSSKTKPSHHTKVDMQKRHQFDISIYISEGLFWWNFSLVTSPKKHMSLMCFWVVCSCLGCFVDRNSWGGVACLHIFGSDRPLFWRESASGIGVSAFFLSRVTWPPKKQGVVLGHVTSEAGDIFFEVSYEIILIWSIYIYPKHPGFVIKKGKKPCCILGVGMGFGTRGRGLYS